jgi:hypothetical protein
MNVREPLIYFTHTDEQLISVDKSTFGGFIIRNEITSSDLFQTCEAFLLWAKSNNIKLITIRCFPEIYAPVESEMTSNALSKAGFEILFRDITQIIDVRESALPLNTHRKRRLRNSFAKGFSFKILTPDFLAEAHSLFVESRNDKKYPVTMSLENFKDAFTMFPRDYILFGVFDKNKMIASCVSIRVDERILYCFFIGDAIAYRVYSPVTQLLHGVYEFARQKKIEMIDLGISTDKGVLNEGLYNFKKSLGTFDAYKLTYQIKL